MYVVIDDLYVNLTWEMCDHYIKYINININDM